MRRFWGFGVFEALRVRHSSVHSSLLISPLAPHSDFSPSLLMFIFFMLLLALLDPPWIFLFSLYDLCAAFGHGVLPFLSPCLLPPPPPSFQPACYLLPSFLLSASLTPRPGNDGAATAANVGVDMDLPLTYPPLFLSRRPERLLTRRDESKGKGGFQLGWGSLFWFEFHVIVRKSPDLTSVLVLPFEPLPISQRKNQGKQISDCVRVCVCFRGDLRLTTKCHQCFLSRAHCPPKKLILLFSVKENLSSLFLRYLLLFCILYF